LIEVTVRKDEIKISGHANYAVSGSDIVCAGVTALALTLIKSIKDLTDDKIGYKVWESIREVENSGGFLFHWHLYDCRGVSGVCPDHVT
jgi:uncharacterized protein YsxB (DUF464 family)